MGEAGEGETGEDGEGGDWGSVMAVVNSSSSSKSERASLYDEESSLRSKAKRDSSPALYGGCSLCFSASLFSLLSPPPTGW